MNKTTIRPARIESDVPGITAVLNACEPEHPVTLEAIRTEMETDRPERKILRLVAVDAQEAVSGYSYISHPISAPERHFYVWVGVAPTARRQGTGSALWQASLATLQAQGATRLASEVMDYDSTSLVFAGQRGFTIDRRLFASSLDLTRFNDTPYQADITQLESQGIRFCSLADFPDTPETQRKFYELNLAIVRDIPGENWDYAAYPAFFQERIRGAKWFRPESQLLAVEGEAWVGLAAVRLIPEAEEAYNATTGVIRGYRRRKIALALKVLAARYARQHGARQIRTDNDSLNAPILLINQRLGYQPQPGKYLLVRWLTEASA